MMPKEKTSILLAVYQAIRDNQQFYMKQQWAVIYYAILLYAVIFKSYDYLHDSKYQFCMYLVGGVVCLLGILVVCFHEISMCETRKTIRNIENEIPLISQLAETNKSENYIDKYPNNKECNLKVPLSKSTTITFFIVATIVLSYWFFVLLICNYKLKT